MEEDWCKSSLPALPVLVPLASSAQAVAVGIVGGSDLTKIKEQLGPESELHLPKCSCILTQRVSHIS